MEYQHPGNLLQQELTSRGLTQKVFATMIGKKVSEVNELIKGKRNITVQRDILLSIAFSDPEQKRIKQQNDYDYILAKTHMQQKIEEIRQNQQARANNVNLANKTTIDPTIMPIVQEKTKENEVFDDF